MPLRTIDPARLRARRVERGLTRAALGHAAGLSARMIFFYEEGRHTPTPARLKQLAAVLGCGVDELTGARRGEETLVDLRFAAGLSLERLTELLRGSRAGLDLSVSPTKLSALESGQSVHGSNWLDARRTAKLIRPLAQAYGVPVRMVVDAWMRTRPNDPAPDVVRRDRERAPARAASEAWGALNERQQLYLGEIMREERMTETEMWMRRVQRIPVLNPGIWRKLPFALRAAPELVGYTRLQDRLRGRGVHDSGAGQTVHALARRGLLVVSEDLVEHPSVGTVDRVLVELTRRGRAAARAGLGEPRRPETVVPLLSEWLWGVFVRVAAAEPLGLDDDQLAGRALFFIGVGYQGTASGRPSRGFVDSFAVMAPGGTHVAEYRWRLTELGRRHLSEYLEQYLDLYPGVDTTGLRA